MRIEERDSLLRWYERERRDLPWRKSREVYPVLVSEFMLCQTTVAAVIPLYRRWMHRFPTLRSLAEASLDDVVEAWSGLGYYQRARRLHRTAQILLDRGSYPETLEEWLVLPGLGPYTAAAVASIAGRLPHLALDTNAIRVLLRYLGWIERADDSRVQKAIKTRLEPQLRELDLGVFNQALMELGATLCSPKSPVCGRCPLATNCLAKAQSMQENIPRPKSKKVARETPAVAYVLRDTCGRVGLVRGTSLGLLKDLYQPPIWFPAEKASGSDMSPLLNWLEGCPEAFSGQSGAMVYGISGRRLQLVIRTSDSDQVAQQVERMIRKIGIDFRWHDEACSGLALSSLTRKILKVSEETRAGLLTRDDRCPESSL